MSTHHAHAVQYLDVLTGISGDGATSCECRTLPCRTLRTYSCAGCRQRTSRPVQLSEYSVRNDATYLSNLVMWLSLQGYRLGLPYFRAESVHTLNLRSTFSASVGGLVAVILPLYYVFVRYSSGIEFE